MTGLPQISKKPAQGPLSPRVFGDRSQTRDFTFAPDIVDATTAAPEKPLKSRVFNIATGN